MKVLVFLLTLFLVFFLISSMSYQFKPIIKPELKKIDPELMELKSLESQEKVKVIVWLKYIPVVQESTTGGTHVPIPVIYGSTLETGQMLGVMSTLMSG